MNEQEIMDLYKQYIVPSYGKDDLFFVRGKGSRLYDVAGKEYLDFFPGWAVSGLGHCPTEVVRAVQQQVKTLIHLSNNFYHPCQGRLAKRLSESSIGGKVFFCNSGAEANEAAIKLCRLYGRTQGRYRILSMENAFHGRTLATLTLTGQKKYSDPFQPLPEGFSSVRFNDYDALVKAIDKETVAIVLELIQGEGGVNVADQRYVEQVAALCRERDLLFVVDEVQTGFGRTGSLFAFQNFGIMPDIITLAKSMAGGLPVGAMIARSEIADLMVPGTHASTFGGSPLVCAGCLAVLDTIEKKNLLSRAVTMGAYLHKKLELLKTKFSCIKEIRGMGLMRGVEFDRPCRDLLLSCRTRGLLVNCTHDTVLRIMPALTVTRSEIIQAMDILELSLEEFCAIGP
jgi:acetylornithine/N-succinyldiaminopimelate aminotransferase